MLNDHCNPFALQELHFDVCENMNDDALIRCLSKNHIETQVEMQERFMLPATKLSVDILKWRQMNFVTNQSKHYVFSSLLHSMREYIYRQYNLQEFMGRSEATIPAHSILQQVHIDLLRPTLASTRN